jgi:hypothetical protein
MTTIRKIVTSKIDGNSADSNDTNEIRPFGEIAVYLNTEPNPDKLTLMMFDGTRTHLKSMVLAPGRLYGSDADSGDGNNRDTIKLIPDASLSDYTGNDQYLIIDPTGGIRIRAGGTQDQSTADLYIGGEQTFVRVSDTNDNVVIRTTALGNIPIENVNVQTVDELVPPGNVWRIFIITSTYPTLGDTVQIGETVTTAWGTPVTATITDIQQDAGQWQIHVDQNIITGFGGGPQTVTFNRGGKSWTFDNTGNLTLPNDSEIRADGNNLEVGGMTNFNVEALGVANIYTNDGAHQWQFGDDGNLTLPAGGDILDSNGSSVLGSGTAVDTNIWVETFASDTPGDNVISATSVEYDPDGNVVALFSHDDTNNTERYISVAKFDTSGNKLWQQRFAAGQYSDGWGLAVDSTSIYVAGELDGTGSPAAYQVSSLMKLNTANGNVIWMKSYDFGEESYSQVVDVASDSNPVMVGHAYSGGQAFITTTKVDKDTGNIIWTRKLDGQNGEYSYGMAVGPAGEIVVIGYMDNVGVLNAAATLYSDPVSNANWTNNTGLTAGLLTAAVTFTDGVPNFTNIVDGTGNRTVDEVIGTFNGTGFGGTTPADDMTVKVGTVLPGDNSDRMLVVKYDSAGFIQWQKAVQFDAGFDCKGADADIDSDGNIYICGNYVRTDIGGDPWDLAMSLLKMDGNGAKQWSRRVVGDCQDVATSVVVGPDDCLYLSGVTGNNANSDFTFVIAKYSTSGSVLWQRLLDNTTTWTFGSSWFSGGGGSNIAVKNGYVSISGQIGDPGTPNFTAFIAQVSSAGSLFTTGDWDFKGASFSGLLNNTASDLTVTDAGKTDSDNAINITTATQSPDTDNTNFLIPTKYVLSTPIGDLTVVGNILKGTGTDWGSDGLYLAPGPNLAADMYFRVRGGDNATHLHFDTGDNSVYDQYFGDDWKYLKLGANGVISIETNSNTWTFGTDGTTTLPGAVVKSTVAKTGGSGGTFTDLDLTKSINKLTNGDYSLANGVDGQIMHLVMQDGANPSSIGVVVANFRIDGTVGSSGLLVPFKTFNDANATYFDSRGFCTLIFTDGAWQQSGGSWD